MKNKLMRLNMQYFASVPTKLVNLIDPEVMADYIQAKLADLIRFSPLAHVDSTLEGRPGDTITMPKYAYIGDAADVGEGADIEAVPLTASTTTAKVKKAGKGVTITDEATMSAFGDPGEEAARQLTQSIAQKVDNDCMTALEGIKAGMTCDVSATDALVSGVISDALSKFGEDLEGDKVLLIAPEQLAQLRKDPSYINASEIATQILMSGTVGMLWGCQLVLSNKIKARSGKITNYIIKPGALAIFLKRDTLVETDRNITNKTTLITADKHYTTYLLDESKAIKVIVKDKVTV